MKTINSIFKQPNHIALIPYITVGYPSIESTLEVVSILAANGCDMVELGIPFSDPLADGAAIQNASFQALKNGVTPALCLEVAKELSQEIDIPMVFMTYLNPVFNYGFEPFCQACSNSGIRGLIIPDLPPEESSELESICHNHNVDLVYLLAPTSTEKRIKLVASKSSGFIYLVSVAGITGVRDKLPVGLEAFVSKVRNVAKQPICVGFGISTPAQAKQVAKIADGVIVGSRIIQLLEADNSFASVAIFIKEMRQAIDEI
ncbi:MAG: tryptophan synthase subunit alpha [Chloroflexi bacterium]|nr:tryptophan synthase subunit alpha [Chloroflexota bacterium]